MDANINASVLIIDDEPVIRESIAVYLEDSGMTVIEAGDGLEGLQLFRAHAPDVVLVDLRMPEVNGLDVLNSVRQEAPETPIIVVSGTGVIQDAVEALRRGAWDFITKPITNLEVLEYRVVKAIERARLLVENRRYHEHLETEIKARTVALRERGVTLETTNRHLEAEMHERLQAEAKLKRKIEEQELLLDNIQTQVWYLTDRHTYGAVNKARAEFLGLAKKDLERKALADLLQRDEAHICIEGNREVFERKQQVHSEEWALNGMGQKRLLSVTKTPRLDSQDSVEYVVCSAEDITDYKNAVDALRRNKERLSLALEATQHAIWDWNLQTRKTYFSPRCYAMLGQKEREEATEWEAWQRWIKPVDRPAWTEAIEDCLRGKNSDFKAEYRIQTRGGQWLWVLSRGKVVERNGHGDPIRIIGTHVDITERKHNEEALRLSEAHLRDENLRLKSTLKGATQFGSIIGKSEVMREVYELILKAAGSDANVIIYGESGTGKELVAQTIHQMSQRSQANFVPVNCGAIPQNLLESEFFGYRKGAFTGAQTDKPGYIESANQGTLFLDEVGELDLNMQVKLLRVIDGGGFMPIGSRRIINPDVRFIAATNRDMKKLVSAGQFRDDFFYRIHIIPIHLPPLKERKEDISLLVRHFLEHFSDDNEVIAIPEEIMKAMQHYDWPGNVRELQNTIHRFVTLKEIDFLNSHATSTAAIEFDPPSSGLTLDGDGDEPLKIATDRFEKNYIQHILQKHHWRRQQAAAKLGISRRTLYRKMKSLELE